MVIPSSVLAALGRRNAIDITTVYIHHSVADPTIDVAQIAEMEQASQGFITVGYNAYVKCIDVEKDVWVVQQARPLECIPAAQYGDNTHGYAICIGGNYHPGGAPFLTKISQNALKAAAGQIAAVKNRCFNLKYLQGHRDVSAEMLSLYNITTYQAAVQYGTACPGDMLYAEMETLRNMTGLQNRLNHA